MSVDVSAIKPIYAALTKERDLEKCLHRLTQNSNESFNATIWGRASKSIYCGREVLEIAVYDDVANYNYGGRAILDIFELLNMKPGHFTTKMCSALNVRRKYNAANHNTPAAKQRRKIIRGLKKKKSDQQVSSEQASSEGVSYEPGGF